MTAIEPLLRELGDRARLLEPAPEDVATIVRRAHAPARRSRRGIAAAAVAVVVATTAAVPTTRTAVGSAVDSFFGGRAPGHEVNGRVLQRDELPRWLRRETRRALVVAGSGRHRLVAHRSGGEYCFDYGDSAGECATANDWEKMLAEHPVVLRGPTSGGGHPRGALYGFTRGDVASVRLTSDDRPPLTASARNGGFAIPTDARWHPHELTLLGRHGDTIATEDVSGRF